MRKVIIGITSIILCISLGICSYFYLQCNGFINTEKNNIKRIEGKIKKIDKEIEERKEEVEKIKKENTEKVELLEVWEKELKKVKKDS